MEARQLRAWELLQKGWKQIEVAEALGVSRGAVSRWAALARQEGSQALRRRKPPGGPRKLQDDQLAQLPELLQRGPGSFGFSGEIWTRARIAQAIRQEFGVPITLPRWGGCSSNAASACKSQPCAPPNGTGTPSGTGGTGASQN